MKINIQSSLQTPYKDFFTSSIEGVKINKIMVPIYQREYDWEEDRIIRMLSDLDYYLEDQDQTDDDVNIYFLGAVILEVNSKDEKSFEVVDGQQRLTTFYLMNLLNYLIAQYRFKNPHIMGMKAFKIGKLIGELEKIFKDTELRLVFGSFDNDLLDQDRNQNEELSADFLNRISNKYLVDSKDRDQKFQINDKEVNHKLKKVIEISQISLSDSTIKLITDNEDNPYGEHLETIFTYLHSKFNDENKIADKILEEIQSQIEQYLKNSGMALIISENKDDSFKLFEVLNDTARKLTVLDLMKNYFVDHLKEDYSKEEWRELKNSEKDIKGVKLISDIIKSEGYAKSSYEYSYLSNKIAERPSYYREKESAKQYFKRLRSSAEILKEVTTNQFYKSKVFNNSLLWNLTGINSVKFHWGRQVMLGYLNLSNIYEKEKISSLDVWNDFDLSKYSKLNLLHKFYLISSDLLFKIGLVGKTNNLSSKVLPDTGKSFLIKYHQILNKTTIKEADIADLIEDLKNISSSFFSKQKNNFKNNLDLLNYQNNSHHNIMKHLLYILYNKGRNGSFTLNNISLEHIEPQSERSTGYFEHQDRNRIINGFGNMILLGNKENSAFGNLNVKEKIVKSKDLNNDAFINHRIFESLNQENKTSKGPYSENNFKLLCLVDNYKNYVPTELFFENRKEFYKNELVDMIFNTERYLLCSTDY